MTSLGKAVPFTGCTSNYYSSFSIFDIEALDVFHVASSLNGILETVFICPEHLKVSF